MRDETDIISCSRVGEEPNTFIAARLADDITKFEETTLSSSKCYKVYTHLGERVCISHLFKAILQTSAGPNLLRKEVLPTGLAPDMKKFHTSLRPTGETTFSVDGVICLCIDIGGKVVSVLFGVTPTLTARMILSKAFINEHIKLIEPDRSIIIHRKGRTVSILACYTTDAVI